MPNLIRIDEAPRHCETSKPQEACPYQLVGCRGCQALRPKKRSEREEQIRAWIEGR